MVLWYYDILVSISNAVLLAPDAVKQMYTGIIPSIILMKVS